MAMRTNIIPFGSSTHGVLRMIFERGTASQIDIAKALGMTKSASNIHFLRLREEGIIEPESTLLNGRGRPTLRWKILPAGNYFMGLWLEDRFIAVTIVDFAGSAVFHKKNPLDRNCDDETLRRTLVSAAGEGCRWVAERSGILHQAFFCTGGVVTPEGIFESMVSCPRVRDFDPEKTLSGHFGIPCYSDTLHYAYVQKECPGFSPEATVLLLNWGSHLGGVIVNNRHPLTFAALPARRNRGLWNLGHIVVQKNGAPCYCGQRGCLEQYVGGAALAGKRSGDGVFEEFTARLDAGDGEAVSDLRQAAETLAASLYWPLELFGVDTVLFLGSFTRYFDLFAASFRKGLEEMRTPEAAATISLLPSADPEGDLSVGSALMARHFFFYPEEPLKCRGAYKNDFMTREQSMLKYRQSLFSPKKNKKGIDFSKRAIIY